MKRQFALLAATGLVALSVVYILTADINIPGSNRGYQPAQPIAFSHRLHSGNLEVDCLYCHPGAETGSVAGITPAGTCMNCHRYVTSGWDPQRLEELAAEKEGREPRQLVSEELDKLYRAVGFDAEKLAYRDPATGSPIRWIRIHRLPDFVFFDHRAHINAEVTCQTCHGPVETMETVSQFSDLTMGWCVNCHRDVNNGRISGLEGRFASTECGVCHY